MKFKFELGEVLKDTVTGFKGVALGRTQYHTGCNHYGLSSQELKEGKTLDWEWFDESRLKKVKNTKRVLMPPPIEQGGNFPNSPQV